MPKKYKLHVREFVLDLLFKKRRTIKQVIEFTLLLRSGAPVLRIFIWATCVDIVAVRAHVHRVRAVVQQNGLDADLIKMQVTM